VIERWHPLQIWLFGSRARGQARPDSDWDLLAIGPDCPEPADFEDPMTVWRVKRQPVICSDLVVYRASDFEADRSVPNTCAYSRRASVMSCPICVEDPDANPVKPLLRAIEHLDAYATAYRYPSPRGRVKPAPSPADLEQDIANIDRALTEIATRFQIDISRSTGPAGKPDPIR